MVKTNAAILLILLSFFSAKGQVADSFPEKKDSVDSRKLARKVMILMGSRFEFTALHEDDSLAWKAVKAGIAEVQRIERLISSWDPNSQTSEINRQAGVAPVSVDEELFELIFRADKISHLTQGAFDLSFASMEKLWAFDGSMKALPDSQRVAASHALVDHEDIELNPAEHTVFLKNKGMRIGFGGIGKGYAANRARRIMQEMGIKSGLVNAGGDLCTWGTNIGNPQGWKVAISDPADPRQPLMWLTVQDQAVVTSGNYEKFAMIDGVRYAHILDPRSGWPVQGVKSVTLICPDAEFADAMATAIFVLGVKEGMELINRIKHLEGIIVDDQNGIHKSRGLDFLYIQGEP